MTAGTGVDSRRARTIAWRVVRVVASLALLTWVVSRSDWRILGSLLRSPWLIAWICVLPFIGATVEASRLALLYRALGMELPFAISYQVTAMAAFFNFCIPGATGGDAVKMWYLNTIARRHPAEVAAIWMVDRLTGLFSLLLVVIAVAALNLSFIRGNLVLSWFFVGVIGAAIALVVAAALACLNFAPVFDRLLSRYPRARSIVSRIEGSIAAFRQRPTKLLKAVCVSICGHTALLATFMALGRYFMPAIPSRVVGLLALSGLFANALPITPGGLGVGEAAFDTLFRLVGVATGPALLVAWRIGMMPLCTVGCILYMTGVRHHSLVDARDTTTAAPVPAESV
jgi:glycosyltransferase 2 family protein